MKVLSVRPCAARAGAVRVVVGGADRRIRANPSSAAIRSQLIDRTACQTLKVLHI